LITAYIASFSQYSETSKHYPEIDFNGWDLKISAELVRSKLLLNQINPDQNTLQESEIEPLDTVENLLENRKKELAENEFFDRRDPNRISHLTELKNLKEILELIYDVAKEQRKVAEKLGPEIQSTMVKQ
jgi:hypothetical protein